MALSLQDLLKGVDFTGINPATGADHNNLIELAAPVLDSANEGKGIILWTKDSALDTPIVPDAATNIKWKRYIWLRVLHSTATSHVPLFYGWDDTNVSDPTYLKWQRIEVDTSAIEADIAALTVLVNTATNTANNAASLAATANANAAAALTAANSALALATTADANATTALTAANTAQSTAEATQVAATNAQNTANSAIAVSANAIQIANDRTTKHIKVSDTKARNTLPQVAGAASWNKKELTLEDFDGGNLATLASNEITLQTGTYKVHAESHGPQDGDQILALVDVDANLAKLTGITAVFTNNSHIPATLDGFLVVTASIKTFALYHYTQVGGLMGQVGNVAYNAVDVPEVYTVITFEKLV